MTAGAHLDHWRSIGLKSTGVRWRKSSALRKVCWGAPYLLIWMPASLYATSTLVRSECAGVCALYDALLTFTVVALATVLSAVVALIQLASLVLRRQTGLPMHPNG